MATRDEVFPSKYLKAADLSGRPTTVTIDAAPLETLKNPEGKEQVKTVLYFKKARKSLPLNMVNWDSVAAVAGGDSDAWRGHQIELYPDKTTMGGKLVDCIRIRAPAQSDLVAVAQKAKAAPPPPSVAVAADGDDDDMDDSIPF